jgi:hypothetical protein
MFITLTCLAALSFSIGGYFTNVALSFLRFLEWLRTKLHAIFPRSIPVEGSFLASPDYGRRQIS